MDDWNKCSEIMPETAVRVITQSVYGDIEIASLFQSTKNKNLYYWVADNGSIHADSYIKCWMPLPAPCKWWIK